MSDTFCLCSTEDTSTAIRLPPLGSRIQVQASAPVCCLNTLWSLKKNIQNHANEHEYSRSDYVGAPSMVMSDLKWQLIGCVIYHAIDMSDKNSCCSPNSSHVSRPCVGDTFMLHQSLRHWKSVLFPSVMLMNTEQCLTKTPTLSG